MSRTPPAAKPNAALPRLFTVAQVAERLQLSTRTVWRLVARKELRAHRIKRAVRIAENDLHDYLRSCRA